MAAINRKNEITGNGSMTQGFCHTVHTGIRGESPSLSVKSEFRVCFFQDSILALSAQCLLETSISLGVPKDKAAPVMLISCKQLEEKVLIHYTAS